MGDLHVFGSGCTIDNYCSWAKYFALCLLAMEEKIFCTNTKYRNSGVFAMHVLGHKCHPRNAAHLLANRIVSLANLWVEKLLPWCTKNEGLGFSSDCIRAFYNKKTWLCAELPSTHRDRTNEALCNGLGICRSCSLGNKHWIESTKFTVERNWYLALIDCIKESATTMGGSGKCNSTYQWMLDQLHTFGDAFND